MAKENLLPALLDLEAGAVPLATQLSPPKKGRAKPKGPQTKKLHWTPIKGRVEGTIWSGPPGDIAAASSRLVPPGDGEALFRKLFVQDPDAAKKKKVRRAQLCVAAPVRLDP